MTHQTKQETDDTTTTQDTNKNSTSKHPKTPEHAKHTHAVNKHAAEQLARGKTKQHKHGQYRYWRLLKLPTESGIAPLSWLLDKSLQQTHASHSGCQMAAVSCCFACC